MQKRRAYFRFIFCIVCHCGINAFRLNAFRMECTHPLISCIEDEREGTIVCTLCAHVLGQLYVHEHGQGQGSSITNGSLIPLTASPIDDICANFNISSSIKQHCEEILQSIQNLSQTSKVAKNILYAYCVYRGLIDHGVARSPQEIYCMTGVELTKILEVEKLITNTSLICEYPSSDTYIERFAIQCGLNFQDIQCISFYCAYANECCENYAPQTIAAALISIFCKTHKNGLAVKFIASKCLVSSSSIYRIIKKLNISTCDNCNQQRKE